MSKTKYYKHPRFGHVYGEDIKIPVSRVTWPSLAAPRPLPDGQDGQPRYEITFLLPKTDPKTEFFVNQMKVMSADMLELFNKGRAAGITINKFCMDGDDPWPGFDKEAYPYYAGNWVVVARNTSQPQIVGADKQPIEANFIKAGMFCTAILTPIITAHGVSYKLGIVQFKEDDGTRWSFQKDLASMLDDDEPATETAAAPEAPKKAATGKQAALDRL